MLTVRKLSKTYFSGDRRQSVFDDLDLDVGGGEVVALLGASGSGKTTLLNLLSGIDRPDAGDVRLDGTSVLDLAEPGRTRFRRENIGFVFQFFNLIPTLSVGENVALPLELTGATPTQTRERTTELLGQVGLQGMAGRFPDTLSGGEQQRTAVARALAHRPRLLLADEPTGNLDEDTGAQITDLLSRLAREQGTAMLLVTHSGSVASCADRALRLLRGSLTTVQAVD